MKNESFVQGFFDELSKHGGLRSTLKRVGRVAKAGVTHPVQAARGFMYGLTGQHKKEILEATLAKRRHRLKYGRKASAKMVKNKGLDHDYR